MLVTTRREATSSETAALLETMDASGLLKGDAAAAAKPLESSPTASWPAVAQAASREKWQCCAGAAVAIATVVAGAYFSRPLIATAVALVGSGFALWRTRRFACFRCMLVCHLKYASMRRRARKLGAGGAAPVPAELQALWDATHAECAEQCFATVAQLQGLWVKMAQLLATRSDILPAVYCRLLANAQDQMPAAPLEEIRRQISAQGRAVDAIFSDLQATPLGSASIAQVHRARLRESGADVVIKVQHTGVEARMAADVCILTDLLRLLRWLEPEFDLTPIARQWVAALPQELDFEREAANMEEMGALLRRPSPGLPWAAVDAVIPAVHRQWSSRRVLVQDFEPGAALNDVAAVRAQLARQHPGVPVEQGRLELLRGIARWYGRGLFLDGLFHADPHPGNFLLSAREAGGAAGPRPVLLDFGLVKRLDPSTRAGLATLCLGAHHLMLALTADGAQGAPARRAVLAGFAQLGFPIAEADTELMLDVAVFLFRPSQTAAAAEAGRAQGEAKQVEKVLGTRSDRQLKQLGPSAAEARQKKLSLAPLAALPEELILFQRVLTLFRGLCTQHSVEIAFISEVAPFAEQLLRQNGALPAELALSAGEGGEGGEGGGQQRVPGTAWAMRFDGEGEVEYVHLATGRVVFETPPEVAAAEAALMA
jgi:predicted unusual protein kinase regulating ubiquinone biosynthesis (AarF/ABC1/UbiB family)